MAVLEFLDDFFTGFHGFELVAFVCVIGDIHVLGRSAGAVQGEDMMNDLRFVCEL